MASLAHQDIRQLGGRRSVLHLQKQDHIRLDGLLERLGSLPAGEQGPVLRKIYRLVFPHAFAEESVLWPTLRRVLPDGQRLTLRVELEHQEINELVSRLEALDLYSAERRKVLEHVIKLLRQDVRDEEDLLLPRLQEKLTTHQLRLLGLAWAAVRSVAPTRAHPIVARRPPGNVLAALPLTLIDRSRDGVDALLDHGAGPVEKPLQALGSALARAARAVEALPGMQSGEDPRTRIRSAPPMAQLAAGALIAVAASGLVAAVMHRRRIAGAVPR